MEQILLAYYADNARKLRETVDKILMKFGGLSNKDLDDFYSLANEVFAEALGRYDGSRPFDGFLYSCLFKRIKSEFTRRNREKRRLERMCVSVDAPFGDGDAALGEVLVSDFDIDREMMRREGFSGRMLLYLGKLSALQRRVLWLTADGYPPEEIREELQISEKQFAACNRAIHSYRNLSVLL